MPEQTKLKVFLCHASQDKPIVRGLYERLSVQDIFGKFKNSLLEKVHAQLSVDRKE